ncbi:unnamed protein product [Auanema sp. JU1783]|nr:unnamed protein product [Auanema sp. JU1783]
MVVSKMMSPAFVPQMGSFLPPAYELIPNRVFVGGFPPQTTEAELREHFAPYFFIREAKVVRATDGISKGYGFLTLETEEDADAVREMDPEKLMFKGRKLNLGPALRKIKTGSEYAIATPAGLVQSGGYGSYGYPVPQQHYVMAQPHFVFNTPSHQIPAAYPMMYTVSGSPTQENQMNVPMHQQPIQNGEMVNTSSPMKTANAPPPQPQCMPYYYVPVQPSTPVNNSLRPMMNPPYYSATPEGLLTPISAPPTGYPNPHGTTAQNFFYNQNMASGDNNMQQNEEQPSQQGQSVFYTPPQRPYAAVVASNNNSMTPSQENVSVSEGPRHPSAVRRINLFNDQNNASGKNVNTNGNATAGGSFTTPVRLESRQRGPDGQYRNNNTSKNPQHMRYIRPPPSDKCSPSRLKNKKVNGETLPAYVSDITNQFSELQLSSKNTDGSDISLTSLGTVNKTQTSETIRVDNSNNPNEVTSSSVF